MREEKKGETFPSAKECESLLLEAGKLNPGPWTDHCRTAGACARKTGRITAGQQGPVPEKLLRDAKIWTGTEHMPWDSFMILEGGKELWT